MVKTVSCKKKKFIACRFNVLLQKWILHNYVCSLHCTDQKIGPHWHVDRQIMWKGLKCVSGEEYTI